MALALRPKLSCSRVLAPRRCLAFTKYASKQRLPSAALLLCVHADAFLLQHRGSAALASRCIMHLNKDAFFSSFFTIFLLGFDLLVVSSNFPRFNLKITSKQVKSNIKLPYFERIISTFQVLINTPNLEIC